MMNSLAFGLCLGVAVFQFSIGNVGLGLLNIGLALINVPFMFMK